MTIGERELGLKLMMKLYPVIINSFKIVTLDVDVAYSWKVIVDIPNLGTKWCIFVVFLLNKKIIIIIYFKEKNKRNIYN